MSNIKILLLNIYIACGTFVMRMYVAYMINRCENKRNKKCFFNDSDKSILYITNDNGGGTKYYEERFVGKNIETIILKRIGFGDSDDLAYQLIDVKNQRTVFIKKDELPEVFKYSYKKIIISTLVAVSNFKLIIEELINYKKSNESTEIVYLVHDFHSVCPNYTLFVDNHDCKLNCFHNRCKIKTSEIVEWRRVWESLFDIADEIRCFSEYSREIIEKCYGKEINKITVIPHDISYIKYNPLKETLELPLHIGIVGDCRAEAKGQKVVIGLIERFGDDIPISVIGPWPYKHRKKKDKVHYCGRYNRDDLRKILEREKVNFVIFPSLCGETFSYLVSELIALDIPVACFDIGAQKEKISAYKRGIVCKNSDELVEVIERIKR